MEYNDFKTCCENVVQKGDTVVATIHVVDSDIESDSDTVIALGALGVTFNK